MNDHKHRLINSNDARVFALGGNATFTVLSVATGVRYTYRVRKPQPASPHFVQVLTGADNENSYTFLGSVFSDGRYAPGKRSSIAATAPSALAFAWLWTQLGKAGAQLPGTVEFWTSGKCARCGRKLTVTESISTGFGPECIKLAA